MKFPKVKQSVALIPKIWERIGAEVGSCQDKTEDQRESLLKGREVSHGCVLAAGTAPV